MLQHCFSSKDSEEAGCQQTFFLFAASVSDHLVVKIWDDMAEPQETSFGFEQLKKLKIPSINSFLASKPNNVVSGAITGIGQTIGGAVVAMGE